MRLSQTEKYWMNSYIVLLLIFITGFAFAADPKKVENCYGKLKHLNDSYKIKETFSKNEFTASLYEKKNNLSK